MRFDAVELEKSAARGIQEDFPRARISREEKWSNHFLIICYLAGKLGRPTGPVHRQYLQPIQALEEWFDLHGINLIIRDKHARR